MYGGLLRTSANTVMYSSPSSVLCVGLKPSILHNIATSACSPSSTESWYALDNYSITNSSFSTTYYSSIVNTSGQVNPGSVNLTDISFVSGGIGISLVNFTITHDEQRTDPNGNIWGRTVDPQPSKTANMPVIIEGGSETEIYSIDYTYYCKKISFS